MCLSVAFCDPTAGIILTRAGTCTDFLIGGNSLNFQWQGKPLPTPFDSWRLPRGTPRRERTTQIELPREALHTRQFREPRSVAGSGTPWAPVQLAENDHGLLTLSFMHTLTYSFHT